ncbi:hypothetical protein GCM10011399_31710 [Subtercola lobariae]|uniref:Uncharacterized protein n=1 Tax=Subtercola lobariae TaxID=1588641 RepID=A0A917BC30_9MICO|nr:hypothetical protein GCM10011399_31710 [Subtercola lobariae]
MQEVVVDLSDLGRFTFVYNDRAKHASTLGTRGAAEVAQRHRASALKVLVRNPGDDLGVPQVTSRRHDVK